MTDASGQQPGGEPGGGTDGRPTALLRGFAGAATQWSHATGDPDIAKSFLLGWRIGVAFDWAATGAHEMWPDDDPGLQGPSRWAVLRGQIESAARELTNDAGDEIVLGSLGDAPPAVTSQAVGLYCTPLLQRLYVRDQFCGLAFTLGCDLEGACAGTGTGRLTSEQPQDRAATPASGAGEFATAIPALKKPLLGLATKLPPNAAHSVINSLTLWEEQLHRHGPRFDPATLRKQGGAWRSILSGDVAAKDLLHLSDYIGTAEQVTALLRDLVRGTVKRHLLVPAIVLLALAVAGFVLLFFSQTAAAGAAALLTALGLSWKGAGQYLGKVAAQAEQSLWNGQVDWTIAYRATMSLTEPAASPARRRRDRTASHELRRRADHFDTWQRWREEWPVFELEQ